MSRSPATGRRQAAQKWRKMGVWNLFLRSFFEVDGGDQERGQDKQAADEQQEHVGMLSEQKQGSQSR